MSNAFSALFQNSLGFKLVPISIRELLYLEECPCEIYGLRNGLFAKLLGPQTRLTKDLLMDLIKNGHARLFVHEKERLLIIQEIQDNLLKITRSLSIGDPLENCKKQMNLLTIHMEYVYLEPTNDDRLALQVQSAKNLFLFLMEHLEIHEQLFYYYIKQKHHYIFAQPMISTFLLCGILKLSKMYPAKENEILLLSSYFKDIGMSTIPIEHYDKKNLSDSDKEILSHHAETSVKILEGRISLSPSAMDIIAHHHAFSILNKEIHHTSEKKLSNQLINPEQSFEKPMMIGTETVFVCTMDIIAAMITTRPWREAERLFDALDLVKKLISDDFPQEFKSIVSYFKNFSKK